MVILLYSNAFWRGAMPGLASYPNLNLTVSLVPVFVWPQVSINAGSTVSLNSLAFRMSISIVNGTTVTYVYVPSLFCVCCIFTG